MHDKYSSENNKSILKRIVDYLKNYFKGCGGDKKSESQKSEKKTINPFVIWALIIAIAVMFMLRLNLKDDVKNKNEDYDKEYEYSEFDNSEYSKKIESDLKEILEKIDGAGEVSVRVYISGTSEKVLAENKKNEENTVERESEKSENKKSETQAVITSGGLSSSGTPYVLYEKLPYPTGVVVVAKGARDEKVRYEMYESIKALYGISANRIKIAY